VASSENFTSDDSSQLQISEHDDYFATISIKIDPSLTVKPLMSQPVSETDRFTTITKFVFYEKAPNMVKVRLPELAAIQESSRVLVDF